jgi:hypothetical protein
MTHSGNKQDNNQEKGIAGFEKLWVWQKAHLLMVEVHEICKKLPYQERFKTKDQLERSSASVTDNIAEGHTSYYYQDKIKSLPCRQKRSWRVTESFKDPSSKEIYYKRKGG